MGATARPRARALTSFVLVAVAVALIGARPAAAQNIVLVIADDVGAEWFTAYAEQSGNPPTPTIETLAAAGVLFRTAWAYPVCSPFRVSVYTGLHPFEHGAGRGIASADEQDYVLDPSGPNLANLLAAAGYRTSAVGKWHMATELGFSGSEFYDSVVSITEGHPNATGMQHFSGFLFGGLLYWDWWKTVNGVTTRVTDYATTDTADAAIAQLSGSEPFFLWVAFNAPHAVFHDPPEELLADPSIYSGTGVDRYRAMIEALDTEFGRVLQHVDPTDTTVIFVADNGTVGGFLQPPRSNTQGKGTVYETGVRVPLIVAGQAVAASARGSETNALVQATDLFPTILDLAGLEAPKRRDAVSMLSYLSDPAAPPQRPFAYTEMFTPNGGPIDPATHLRAARGPRYKLVRRGFTPDELYDLQLDPYELSPLDLAGLLPQEQAAYELLQLAIDTPGDSSQVPGLPSVLVPLLIVALLAWARGALLRPAKPEPGRGQDLAW